MRVSFRLALIWEKLAKKVRNRKSVLRQENMTKAKITLQKNLSHSFEKMDEIFEMRNYFSFQKRWFGEQFIFLIGIIPPNERTITIHWAYTVSWRFFAVRYWYLLDMQAIYCCRCIVNESKRGNSLDLMKKNCVKKIPLKKNIHTHTLSKNRSRWLLFVAIVSRHLVKLEIVCCNALIIFIVKINVCFDWAAQFLSIHRKQLMKRDRERANRKRFFACMWTCLVFPGCV